MQKLTHSFTSADPIISEKHCPVSGIIYLLDITSPEYKAVNVGNLDVPPSVALVTVESRIHDAAAADKKKKDLPQRYASAFCGDHFGSEDQY